MKITELKPNKIYKTSFKHLFPWSKVIYVIDISINENDKFISSFDNNTYCSLDVAILTENKLYIQKAYSNWTQKFEEII